MFDVGAQLLELGSLRLLRLRFDERFVELPDLSRLVRRDNQRVGQFEGLHIFGGGIGQAAHLALDLSHQQARRQSIIIALNGVLQMAKSTFQTIPFRAQQAKVKVECGTGITRFQNILQFVRRLCLLLLCLSVNGLAEMQKDLGLFGVLLRSQRPG